MGRQFAVDSCGLGGAEQVFSFHCLKARRQRAEQETPKEVKSHADPPRQLGGPHKEPGKLWQ